MRGIALSCLGLFLVSFFLILPKSDHLGISRLYNSSIQNTSLETISEYADTTVVEMKTGGIDLNYSVTEIKAKSGDILLIRYINESDMSHNIVVVREEEDIRPVGIAALQAISSDWIPEKEKHRIIAHSELAYAGDTVEFSFKVPPPGTYPYICTYSAHWTQMQGRLISTE
ncbi:plastocyanin/azurin family copper-binding protein [Lunatibacter salilacus]|uniref:plastocyanin/azurin family copper-binding protein n=1 Tax=Lunatibacter salilacus TaxID=2483804 RepID=UPI00131BF872|nr:plastocyanin/azurin family copper-binding protein [Lunatibacter salilacus]